MAVGREARGGGKGSTGEKLINVNSVVSHSKRFELIEFSELHKPDIILLSETKLNKNHKLQFQNYEILRTDRPNAITGGGTAILIKKNLQYTQIFTPSSLNNEVTEFTIVRIKLKHNFNLYVVSLYANNDSRNLFINEIIWYQYYLIVIYVQLNKYKSRFP